MYKSMLPVYNRFMSNQEIKKNRTQAAIQLMKEANYDPLKELIRIAQDDRVALEDRIDCHKALIKYVYPTLKHVEVDAQIKQDLIVQVKQFMRPEKVVSIEGARDAKQLPGQGVPIQDSATELRALGQLQGHPAILPD